MGMQLRPEIQYVGIIGHEKANDEVVRHIQGGQDQVDVRQVTLLGMGMQ